jgi:hypothetical protein
MVESISPAFLIYLNSFLLFLIAGWFIRTIVLPYKVARRVGRRFSYGYIGPEDRATLTKDERRLLIAQRVLAIVGLLAFVLCGLLLFRLAGQLTH